MRGWWRQIENNSKSNKAQKKWLGFVPRFSQLDFKQRQYWEMLMAMCVV